VTVDIDRNRPVTVLFDGSAIVDGGDATDLFTAFDDAIAAARSGDADAAHAASHALQRALDRASQTQSTVGTSLRAIADHTSRLEDAGRSSTARVAALEEANMAEAISGLQQAETAYNAALGAAARTTRRSLFDFLPL
jgi:flagellar hook-associated protein 3 FlgL